MPLKSAMTLAFIFALIAVGLAIELIVHRGKLPRAQRRLNLAATTLFVFTSDALAPLLFFWASYAAQAMGGGLIAIADFWIALLVIVVASDFIRYWEHRLAHAFLWPLHSLHHSDPHVNITSYGRFHVGETLLHRLLHTIPLSLLIGAPPEAFAIAAFLFQGVNIFLHLDVRWSLGPINALLNNPQFHRIHHSRMRRHVDRNFATLFPLWDVLFGTYCAPRRGEFPETGLHDGRAPQSLLRVILWPLGSGPVHEAGSGKLGTV